MVEGRRSPWTAFAKHINFQRVNAPESQFSKGCTVGQNGCSSSQKGVPITKRVAFYSEPKLNPRKANFRFKSIRSPAHRTSALDRQEFICCCFESALLLKVCYVDTLMNIEAKIALPIQVRRLSLDVRIWVEVNNLL